MGVDILITAVHGFLPTWKSSTINIKEINVATSHLCFISSACSAKTFRAFLDDSSHTGSTERELCALMSKLIKTKGGKMSFQCKKEKTGWKKPKGNKSITCTLLHVITHAYRKIG